jgi:hypothetical protein
MQQVAQNQSWEVAKARALYDEAIKFAPGYYYYPRNLAYYLLPKWRGEPGDTEKFTKEVADRMTGERGDILYFQIATHVICGCEEDPHLSLERIERGFEASEKQYGVSMLNLNLIAFLAANYKDGDSILVDKVLSRIGEQWDEPTWKKKEDFDSTKKWAAKWAPMMVKQREIEATAEANMKTPEGSHYKPSFDKRYRELVQQCVDAQGAVVGKLETLTSIGVSGTVEDVIIEGPGGVCVYQKLRLLQRERTTLFPPPPLAPYWVKLDLDWADFVAVAAK